MFPSSAEGFSGDTLVLTADGYRQLSDVRVGDYVMSHTGHWRRVIAKHARTAVVRAFTHGASTEPFHVTGDQPFEQFDGWKKVSALGHTSHLTRFEQHAVSDKRWLTTKGSLPPAKKYKTLCDCGCGTKMTKIDSRGRSRRFISGHNAGPSLRSVLPPRVVLDADLSYLLGLFIAEGHCDGRRGSRHG